MIKDIKRDIINKMGGVFCLPEYERIGQDKKRFLSLLLEADPCEGMIDRYLEDGELFVLREGETVLCAAVVKPVSGTECELKNIAVPESLRGRGWGSMMLRWLFDRYAKEYAAMLVGTSESAAPFYESAGFSYSHTVPEFFTKNYPEPIFEGDAQCIDMIYYRKALHHERQK